MDEYLKFLESKKTAVQSSGFNVDESELADTLFPFQKYCVKRALAAGRFAVFADCGLGKEQPYSEPVLTPNGFVPMGSLNVGDYVITHRGTQSKILGIYEQGLKDVYRVDFSDGTSTRCGLNHLWTVKTLNDLSKKSDWRTIELREILQNYKRIRTDERYPNREYTSYNYSIPVCDAVEFNGVVPELDAYVLGVLLGDGCISQSSVRIAKPNDQLRKKVASRMSHGDVVSEFLPDGMTFSIKNKVHQKPSWVKTQLVRLGLMGLKSKEKFIPKEYLTAPIAVRKDLLNGLIGTDGHRIKGSNLIEYSTASSKLKDDVLFLARSLGYIAYAKHRKSYYEKGGELFDNWRVYIAPSSCRKNKSIINIEKVGVEESRCIYIDHPEHLYVTNDFIVTHNTVIALEWAKHVINRINRPVLILAPLGVVGQTVKEGEKFGYTVTEIDSTDFNEGLPDGIYITNYDNMDNIHSSLFGGVVLDESSILKNFAGKTRQRLIDEYRDTPYKLCCTATPSPNDTTELCNHAEFLNVMQRTEMLAMYFVHDGGSTSDWRLKGHAEQTFWDFVSMWAVMLNNPSDIGFSDDGYNLPPLNVVNEIVETSKRDNGLLFNDTAVSATDYHKELRLTYKERLDRVAEIVNSTDENFIVWIGHDEEGKYLRSLIPDAVEVKGSDKKDYKKDKLLGFGRGEFRVLITKLKIAQFGLNYQNCHNQIFASLDFSFEATYQGIRRSYRFGQKDSVNIYLISTDTMGNVIESFNAKQSAFKNMQDAMTRAMSRNINQQITLKKMEVDKFYKSEHADIRLGDCVQLIKDIPDKSVGFSVFSPPFAELYTYSDKLEDMGNSKDYKEFFIAFNYLVKELFRVMWSGRNVAVHCMDLPIQKGKEGYIGLRDFSGMILKSFEDAGFIYHSRVTIWKNPVTEMQRTKALGLLHKQVKKDAAMSRVGIPDYLLVFRKPGEHEHPVNCNIDVDTWQKYASPVWMDIDYSDTLNGRNARAEEDERHVCLAGDTLVLTKRGYIPIADVHIGDETLTHLGRWRKVIAKKKTRENADVVQVYAIGVPKLVCTPDHKLYARARKFYGRGHKLVSDIDWIEAQHTKGMYLNQKLPAESPLDLTEQECWIIGRWMADGHIDIRGHQYFISVGANKVDEFLTKAGKFVGAHRNNEKCNCTQYGLKGMSDAVRNILSKCGKGAKNKVVPYEILAAPKHQAAAILAGYLSGDGCVCREKTLFASASRALLLGLSILVQRVYGRQMAIYAGRGPRTKAIQGRNVQCSQEWVGVLSPKYGFSETCEDGMWKPVKKIEQKPNCDVWAIEVEEDHSFTAEGCIVKNCPLQLQTINRAVTLWSNPGDTVLTPFLGIGSEVYESIKIGRKGIGFELKDSYFNEAIKNIKAIEEEVNQPTLFDAL